VVPIFSVNATYTSDYHFRGFTQTREKPALQGGFDVTWPNFYVGACGLPRSTWAKYTIRAAFHDVRRPRDDRLRPASSATSQASSSTWGALYYFYPGSYGDYNKPVYLGGMIKDLNYFEGMLSIKQGNPQGPDAGPPPPTIRPDYSGTGQKLGDRDMVSRQARHLPRYYRPRSAPCSPPTSVRKQQGRHGLLLLERGACRSCSPTTSSSRRPAGSTTFDVPTGYNSTVTSCRNLCDGPRGGRVSPSRIDAGGHARAPG